MLLRETIFSEVHEGDIRRALICLTLYRTAFAQKVSISVVEKRFCGGGKPSQCIAVTNVIDRELSVH